MKTSVSIPDVVFDAAEKLAKETGRSRSRLYADALEEYIARHAPDKITEAVNRAIDQVGQHRDPFMEEAARRALEGNE